MSAAPRRRGRHQHAVVRDRREVVIAVAGSAAVVLGTALLIWLMRPGPTASIGKGGILNRQPRAGWLIVLTIAVLLAVAWAVLRPESRVRRRGVVGGGAAVGVLVVAVVVAVLYPGGVVHHYPSAPKPTSSTPSTTPITVPSTAAASSTSAPGSITTVKPPTPATTAPATTAPATTAAPTTAASTTPTT